MVIDMGKRLTISGRVQGVGYRIAFADAANALGLSGWVRNRLDGSVEACVHGDNGAITEIVTWAKNGPPAARVESVQVFDADEPAPARPHVEIVATR
jgi:acylphosphatase